MLVLSVALAMDATAAAASVGSGGRSLRPVLLAAALFGGFQAGMSGLGWWGGASIVAWASSWDHWLAFALLAGLGGRTVWGALRGEADERPPEAGLVRLLALALATSVDAAAAGLTLPLLRVPAPVAITSIGAVTFALSLAGGAAGRRLGDRFGARLDLVGGVVLVALGFKILVEHLGA